MRKRTLSREIALKVLYALDITGDSVMDIAQKYWENAEPVEESVKEFSDTIVDGVAGNRDDLDEIITKYADNWELKRMATIDRNVLRVAVYELLYMPETPPKVAINEAIELAKKYGDKDSGKFVNGILDKISKTERAGEESSR